MAAYNRTCKEKPSRHWTDKNIRGVQCPRALTVRQVRSGYHNGLCQFSILHIDAVNVFSGGQISGYPVPYIEVKTSFEHHFIVQGGNLLTEDIEKGNIDMRGKWKLYMDVGIGLCWIERAVHNPVQQCIRRWLKFTFFTRYGWRKRLVVIGNIVKVDPAAIEPKVDWAVWMTE